MQIAVLTFDAFNELDSLQRAAWTPPPAHAKRGYVKMVGPDFLVRRTGSPVPRDNC